MSMFNLTDSWLTISNLPWFMDLTFQFLMQHYSLKHQTLLLPLDILNWALFLLWPSHFIPSGAITNCPPHFLNSIWTPCRLGGSSSGVVSFCLFILFMGFSQKEYWSGLPFLPPVNHVLSELSSMTCVSWVALHSMAHSFSWVTQASLPQQGSDPWRGFYY